VRRINEAAAALFDWIVYELAGYQTGRLILIGLSFGRIDVEPWQPRQAGGSRARATNVRPLASAACATSVGLAYWLMFALGVAILS
jgi:hypothetical protein